jgi:hypothetical protein
MRKDDFRVYLLASAYSSAKFAQSLVKDKLTFDFRFDVELNASCEPVDDSRFRRFPDDDGKTFEFQTDTEVMDILVRDEHVPVWIDINVKKVMRGVTIFDLLCAGRYSMKVEDFYYSHRGQGPFGIKSPPLPVGWKSGQAFWLNKRRKFLWW